MSNVPIHIQPRPHYRGSKVLDGYTYVMKFRWDKTSETMYMGVKGVGNDVDINGIALLPGKELIAKHGYYQLGQMWMIDNTGKDENPTYDELGKRWTLEYIPLADL